jgi:hypothetical protein
MVFDGTLGIGILWGSLAAYYTEAADLPLRMVPLLQEPDRPRAVYNITMDCWPATRSGSARSTS